MKSIAELLFENFYGRKPDANDAAEIDCIMQDLQYTQDNIRMRYEIAAQTR